MAFLYAPPRFVEGVGFVPGGFQEVPEPYHDPTGSPFKYLAYDLTTGTQLDQLPYQGVKFGRIVNQPGRWDGQLPLADPRTQRFDWQDATRCSRTCLFVDLLGTLIWGGILWTSNYDSTLPGKPLVISAMEFGSYFSRRIQAADYSNTWSSGADPMFVAQRVINDALTRQNIIMGSGITLKLNPVTGEGGPQVQPSYPGTSLQTIESIVSILSQMGYTFGYDFSFDVAYLPGTNTPGVTMNIWYPRQGRTVDQSQIVILVKDVVGYTYPVDGTQQATSVWETGSGTGGIQPVDASASVPGYPLLEQAFPRTQVNDQGTLSNISLGDLGMVCYPVVTPTITLPVALPNPQGVIDQAQLLFGEFDAGDDILFRIDPVAGGGENTDPRFPQGMSFEWRITSWQCTVADKGHSQVLLNLSVPPIQTIPPPAPPGI